uniref:Uncharacterized protein n=1 Tax=Tanacetum cinerariifolium TaxID=118510 RepID=A0A699W3F9_TANCI|nr:hypothetical protein [Tanacetum cinerariifolium]
MKSTAGPSLGSTPADEVPADTGVSTDENVPADQRVPADQSNSKDLHYFEGNSSHGGQTDSYKAVWVYGCTLPEATP